METVGEPYGFYPKLLKWKHFVPSVPKSRGQQALRKIRSLEHFPAVCPPTRSTAASLKHRRCWAFPARHLGLRIVAIEEIGGEGVRNTDAKKRAIIGFSDAGTSINPQFYPRSAPRSRGLRATLHRRLRNIRALLPAGGAVRGSPPPIFTWHPAAALAAAQLLTLWQQGIARIGSPRRLRALQKISASTVRPHDTGTLTSHQPAIDTVRDEPGRLEISGQCQINHPLGEHVDTPATVWHPSHQCDPNPVA
jgi:hypothetical protein